MFKKNDNKQIHITVDSFTIWRIIALVVVAFLALLFISNVIQPLILIIVSFFLAIALNPVVSSIAKNLHIKSRAGATGIAYVLVIGILVAFFSFVFPPLVRQTIDFVQDIPETIQSLKDENTPLGSFVQRYQLSDDIDTLTADFSIQISDVREPAISTAGKIGTTLVSTVVVLVLTFMMIVEGPMWIKRYYKILKPKHREHHQKLAEKMYKVIVGYVNGQLVISLLGGFFATIALFIASQVFDVQINAIALGGIIALFALLPMIGTIIGSIIVVLACLLVSFPLAIVMTIYFIVYQQIENVTIQPYIQSKTNTLTPMLVLIAALIGVGIGGILGALLAIPVAGCIKIVVDDYIERKRGISLTNTSEK